MPESPTFNMPDEEWHSEGTYRFSQPGGFYVVALANLNNFEPHTMGIFKDNKLVFMKHVDSWLQFFALLENFNQTKLCNLKDSAWVIPPYKLEENDA